MGLKMNDKTKYVVTDRNKQSVSKKYIHINSCTFERMYKFV